MHIDNVDAWDRKVLVVEDEPRIATLAAKALRREGYEVLVAEDGGLGLFLALTDRVDVVVLDLRLPGRSGLDVLRDLHASRPKVRVVILTADDEPAVRGRCLRAGAAAFLVKPFSTRDLCEAVARQWHPRAVVA